MLNPDRIETYFKVYVALIFFVALITWIDRIFFGVGMERPIYLISVSVVVVAFSSAFLGIVTLCKSVFSFILSLDY